LNKSIIVVGKGSIGNKHYNRLLPIFGKENIFHIGSREFNLQNNKKFDFAIIASPASSHIPHLGLLKNNCRNILIEKPLSNNLDSIDNLNLSIGNSSIFIAYCFRFNPVILKLKEILQQGQIGEIFNVNFRVGSYLPNWRNIDYRKSVSANKKLGGGVLLELSHEIDLLIWLFGRPSLKGAVLRNHDHLELDVEAISDVLLESPKKEILYLHQDFLSNKDYRTIEIYGLNGTIECDLIKETLDLTLQDDSIKDTYEFSTHPNMYDLMIKTFIDSECSNKNFASLSEGVEVLRLIEEIKSTSYED
jgi:predicted dehydrogenase